MNPAINIERIKELIGTGGRIQRAAQACDFETAMEAFTVTGKLMVPGFTVDEDNSFAYENLVRWLINDPAMQCESPEGAKVPASPRKGIYLQGGTGTGKSKALNLLRTLALYLGVKIKADGDIRSIAWETYRADDICDIFAAEGELRRWKETVVLCIQDLGSEPGEILYMGNRRRVLGSIIEARGDLSGRLTLISSNMKIDKAGSLYGPRVQSRLIEMCNILTLSGPDRRRK